MESSGDPGGLLGPRLDEPLPAADLARIDPGKLVSYALDPENAVGRHKAIVFARALGIHAEDWRYLRDAVLRELPHQRVTGVREPKRQQERYTWEVLVPVTGLREQVERTLLVITAWEMIDNRPELITIRVAPKARQPAE